VGPYSTLFTTQAGSLFHAGFHRSYLSQLEKDAYFASLKIVGRLAEALGVEPAELLRLRESKRPGRAG